MVLAGGFSAIRDSVRVSNPLGDDGVVVVVVEQADRQLINFN